MYSLMMLCTKCLPLTAGSGILTEADGSIYEGGFHKSMRHGEGMQMYRYTVDIP
jgi:hypothetical protein